MNTISLSDLIFLLKTRYSSLQIRYVHPLLYIVCIDNDFKSLSSDERLERVATNIGIQTSDLQNVASRAAAEISLLTQQERKDDYSFLDTENAGQHWLSWYGREILESEPSSITDSVNIQGNDSSTVNALPPHPVAVHFYGFKGGQARSTTLSLLAKSLADDGKNVLIIDADLEAPSLDSLFNVNADFPSSTLMGLSGWSDEVTPIPRIYIGRRRQGQIDLLAARPNSQSYDLDFAGFLLRATIDARVLEHAVRKLRLELADRQVESRYDVVLFDHRTGLASSVLPIMEGWPGPTVIFLRPDGMYRHLEQKLSIRALLARGGEMPGAFVTFSLDPSENTDAVLQKHGDFVEGLLEILSDAMTEGDISGDNDIDPLELQRYWMLWHHDPTILNSPRLLPGELSVPNRQSLTQLREVLGFEYVVEDPASTLPSLSKSGATDQGLFILTPDIARVFSLDSKILYIFGRKGTGKTRLVRELARGNLGEPLLVANDYLEGGIQSGGTTFLSLLQTFAGNYRSVWWTLLAAGLRAGTEAGDGAIVKAEVLKLLALDPSARERAIDPKNIEASLEFASAKTKRVFLIDGVETSVAAAQLRSFVESLFQFLASVQYSRILSNFISIRLFLRSDLYKSAAQNVEQQIEGSSLDLRWDRSSILNFAVARIASLEWFSKTFPDVRIDIGRKLPILARGGLSDADAEDLLLRIFPKSLERNKVKTTTFFSTYFSDAGGDSDSKASFYPRLFDGFLREIDQQAAQGSSDVLFAGRLSSDLVLRAYDVASASFLDEVRTELYNLVSLTSVDSQNRDAVNSLIDGFSGLQTPFIVEEIVSKLQERTGLEAERIREALVRLKQIGFFEDRPSFPGYWRTGRLYKAGLKMKYVRTRSK